MYDHRNNNIKDFKDIKDIKERMIILKIKFASFRVAAENDIGWSDPSKESFQTMTHRESKLNHENSHACDD